MLHVFAVCSEEVGGEIWFASTQVTLQGNCSHIWPALRTKTEETINMNIIIVRTKI